jgi:hypothetical protein
VDAYLGYSVSGVGDVNADGYSDVIVGAPWYDAGESDEGAAFVFLGSGSGVGDADPSTAGGQLESDQSGAHLGSSVSGAGDVNGDGYADVIVGAPSFANGQSGEGAAFVFLGSASGVVDADAAAAHAQLESDQVDAAFGTSVSGAGDVDGDGYADVLVGAPAYDAGQSDEGAAFVFQGSDSGVAGTTPATADAQLESDQVDALLGTSVSRAGDVNGDGFSDVIVGAPIFAAGESGEGAAFIFHGSASGVADATPATADAQLESDQVDANLGASVADAGDVNGDGYADVITGAPLYDDGKTDEGVALLFLGSATGVADADPATAATLLRSNQADSHFGVSVSGAGDLNGDGYADVIIGADLHNKGNVDEGVAFVYLGSASGIAETLPVNASAQLESNQGSAGLGMSVAGAGDVNGDGFADVIVGSPYYNKGQSDEGLALIFHGNGDGRPVAPQQLLGDGSEVPVEPWGRSNEAESFAVRVQATHPQGRGSVGLEIEFCEAGLAFGDSGCETHTSASWTDVTATSSGVALTETVTGLTEWTLYRWRARVLHAPYSVAELGITSPPNPAHGPWRRVAGQAVEADIRAVPEPGVVQGFAVGVVLLSILDRRRQRQQGKPILR